MLGAYLKLGSRHEVLISPSSDPCQNCLATTLPGARQWRVSPHGVVACVLCVVVRVGFQS